MDDSAALASFSLPLRVASMTVLTAAISAGDVAFVGAIAKGPETGRASGRNSARLANRAPCRPTLACANAEAPGGFGEPGTANPAEGFTPAADVPGEDLAIAGRGRGRGTF